MPLLFQSPCRRFARASAAPRVVCDEVMIVRATDFADLLHVTEAIP